MWKKRNECKWQSFSISFFKIKRISKNLMNFFTLCTLVTFNTENSPRFHYATIASFMKSFRKQIRRDSKELPSFPLLKLLDFSQRHAANSPPYVPVMESVTYFNFQIGMLASHGWVSLLNYFYRFSTAVNKWTFCFSCK